MSTEGDSIPQPKKDSFAALRYKEFRSYLGLRFFFTFAYQMQTLILLAYVYDITKNKIARGAVGLSEAVPAILIALYGGYIAEKSEKRKMLLAVSALVVFSSVIMAIVTSKAIAPHMPKPWIMATVYAMIFLNGVSRAFYGPATFTIY